jgi:GR25 family glycosyltransferase involved in LPS biosynthesis
MRVDWILLLYNRPNHSKRVLESLASNQIDRIFVYIDYPKDSVAESAQKALLEILRAPWPFKIHLTQRQESFGLARSVCASLNDAFKDGAEAVVLLEDDCVLKDHGKHFFEQGLDSLRNDKNVRSLCGYTNPNCSFIFEPGSDLLSLHRFSTWGWATWSDRWQDYNRNSTLGELLKRTETTAESINHFAPDLAVLCKDPDYLNGSIDIWSIPWTLIHFLTNTYAIFPIESVIENIGLDGSGANCSETDAFNLTNEQFTEKLSYSWNRQIYFFQNEDLIRIFMESHGLKTFPTKS